MRAELPRLAASPFTARLSLWRLLRRPRLGLVLALRRPPAYKDPLPGTLILVVDHPASSPFIVGASLPHCGLRGPESACRATAAPLRPS